MKKHIGFALSIILICTLFSACANTKNPVEENTADGASFTKYTQLQPNDNGNVTIPTKEITKTARYFNYDADGITIQLVALRDNNDGVHIAYNTCQSCSPSPKAYYQQSGDVLECANCGFTFKPEQVGITAGGCNPSPIDGVCVGDEEITIPVSSLDAMKSSFTGWAGPTK